MEIPKLHPETIAEVKERVDLVELISDYVILTKRGKEFIGLCPFHEENTPSFTVSPTKQVYHCFGCGAGGGAIKFLMEINRQSFSDAILNLAQRYQIPIKTLDPQQRQEIQRQLSIREQLYQILAIAASFYQHALYQPEGQQVLQYLQRERNLKQALIQQFKLGYAPSGWDTLFHYLVEIKRYPVALVEQVGLVKKRKKGGGFIDYFRDRLMVPIEDPQGRIIAFGGRSLDGSEPKYLNSPDTELFAKSKTLFALAQAKNSIIKEDKVIIVEGYFDAIALHGAGIKNTVAVLGTAFSQDHLKQLSRYIESKEIIFNFDADRAGLRATERTIQEIESLAYSGQIQLKILNIPSGKDADEFIQSAPDAIYIYRELVRDAPLWLDWQIERILAAKDLKKVNEFDGAFQEIVKLLNKINSYNTRNNYLAHCAELLTKKRSNYLSFNAADYQYIQKSLERAIKRESLLVKSKHKLTKSRVNSLSVSPETKLLDRSEFMLLLIYINCPELREQIANALEEKDLIFSLSPHRFIWQKILELEDNLAAATVNNPNPLGAILQEQIVALPAQREKLSNLLNPNENQRENLTQPSEVMVRAIASLEWVRHNKYLKYCTQEWIKFSQAVEADRMDYFHQEIQKTKLVLTRLEAAAGIKIRF